MITIEQHNGYWTICHNGQGVMSFTSRAAAETAKRGLEQAIRVQVDEIVDEAFRSAAVAQASHIARILVPA